MIRLFVAIAVDDNAVADALTALQTGLPGARWSPRQNLHLTLRFVGEVAEPVADDLDAALESVAGHPFQVEFSGVGAFDDAGRPNAVWAGVRHSDPLTVLHGRCDSAARRAGVARDPRVWKPHVTLAYLGGAEPFRVASWIAAHNLTRIPPLSVTWFGLYSSRRGSSGPSYTLERAYRLA